jgi:hypothetical protein
MLNVWQSSYFLWGSLWHEFCWWHAWNKVSYPTIMIKLSCENHKSFKTFHICNVWDYFIFNVHNKYEYCLVLAILQITWWCVQHLNTFNSFSSNCLGYNCYLLLIRCPHQLSIFFPFQCEMNIHLLDFLIVWTFELIHLCETYDMWFFNVHANNHFVKTIGYIVFHIGPLKLAPYVKYNGWILKKTSH